MAEDFVCPMCGGAVSASASECPGCGEPFSPIETIDEPEFIEETITEVTEELQVPDEQDEILQDQANCEGCNSPLSQDGSCSTCSPIKKAPYGEDGCPMCGNKEFSVESGDLVSCGGCGNVYVRPEFEPTEQNWKWKFWIGLVFILIGNVGVALGSYVHNVAQWSPMGQMYLGYGWIDQAVGIIGIVLFIVGLFLFAWSFKREREVTCPSCKVIIRESQLTVFEPKEEEELPESIAIESALEEIGEMVECPTCGKNVSMFDTTCANCGEVFDIEMDYDAVEEAIEESEPDRLLTASEINEEDMIMDSLELEAPPVENGLNGNGLSALNELESAFELSLAEESNSIICLTCGGPIGEGQDACPGCGEPIPSELKQKDGE